MAFNDDQREPSLPGGNPTYKRETANHLPRYFRTEFNKKFLNATMDQMLNPGQVEKLNVFYGRKNAKAFTSSDNYVGDITSNRENYQLEPVSVIKDGVGNVDFYADYNDYINTLDILKGNPDNHSKLNSQEYYPWDPHIDWDKFINFRNYYWLPDGPETVTVLGRVKDIQSTLTLGIREEDENIVYQWTPDGLTGNRTITLYRGQTYRFEINTPSYPVAIATKISFIPGAAILIEAFEGLRRPGVYDYLYYDQTSSTYDAGGWLIPPREGSFTQEEQENASLLYTQGMKFFDEDGNERQDFVFVEKGYIEWTVPTTAPDTLYYVSKDNANTAGMIKIYDIIEATEIDVNEEIIGRKTYTSENNVSLSNGMKVNFAGTVFPAQYGEGEWYVEGVGDKITLVSEYDLSLNSTFVNDFEVPFDEPGFDHLPYSEALGYPANKDYITINRGSQDRNLWSRHNRWFHIDVIEKSLEINGQVPTVDQSARAIRPIIEFEPGLKLFNHGTKAKPSVDLVDTFTTDVFSKIEGSIGYNIDGVDLTEGMRVLFINDPDILVYGKIYKIKFILHNNTRQITLVEEQDTPPLVNECVHVKFGERNAGLFYHYDGSVWRKSQEKTGVNVCPYFDLFDYNDNSYVDDLYYKDSQFYGNKLFSYKVGDGSNDAELGFPIAYQNINNTGDIVFEFNLTNQEFVYTQENNEFALQKTDTALLRKYTDRESYEVVNGYSTANKVASQIVIRQHIADGTTQTFAVDVYDETDFINDVWIRVYRNNEVQNRDVDYVTTKDVNDRNYIQFINTVVEDGESIIIKTRSHYAKNSNGFYELPYNLERNPLNDDISEFTLGEVIDHATTIIEEVDGFVGTFPGTGNLRDLGNVAKYGRKFLKHSSPFNLSAYHLLSERANVLDALDYARKEYAKFKRAFIEIATNLGYHGEVKQHVDAIMEEFVKDKTDRLPFYFSDMLGFNGNLINSQDLYDADQEYFALGSVYSLSNPIYKAINVYINGKQLLHGKEYVFNDEGFVQLTGKREARDQVDIYEYVSTTGSYIPPTPTKLGLYPKYEPKFYIDDTALTYPDLANTGPYTIYGMAEEGYQEAGKIGWFYPVYIDRDDAITKQQSLVGDDNVIPFRFVGLNRVFYMPAELQHIATQVDSAYDEWVEGTPVIQGHDGSIITAYKDYRDELILELEKRIYNNIKVEYDPNLFDINTYKEGYYRKGGVSRVDVNSAMISDFLAWKRLINREYTDHIYLEPSNTFTFNYSQARYANGERLPGWWRQVYQYAYDTDRPHTHPWEMLGFTVEPSWWVEQYGDGPYTRNNELMWADIEKGIIRQPKFKIDSNYARPGITNTIPVDEYGNLISPNDSSLTRDFNFQTIGSPFTFGDGGPVESAWRRSSEYPFSVIKSILVNRPASTFATNFDRIRQVRSLTNQIVYTPTQKQIQLKDVKFPLSIDDTVNNVITSGLINYIVDYRSILVEARYNDYKYDLQNIHNQLAFKVGGFTDKTKFKLILDSRSPLNEGNIFVPDENYDIILAKSYPVQEYSYSGVIVEKQNEGFYIRGYDSRYPVFTFYRPIEKTSDPVINVGGVSETFLYWGERKTYSQGTIVKYDNTYYRTKITHVSSTEFDEEKFQSLPKLPSIGGINAIIRKHWSTTESHINYGTLLPTIQDVVDFLLGYGRWLESKGFKFQIFLTDTYEIADWEYAAKQVMFWVTQNWDTGSLITVSPGAEKVLFENDFAAVGNVYETSTGYSVLRADGTPLKPKYLKINRDNDNNFSIRTSNTISGIYAIRIPIILREHIVLIDNRTVFNDIIYDPAAGYRQERIKVTGYRVANWNGSLNIPGFIYDEARCVDWEEWRDYDVGQIVKYKEYYYLAKFKVPGNSVFINEFWKKLDEKPQPSLYSNFDYRADQFRDFYDLDSDNFDSEQQRMAQHLIGYQKRNYLSNIINNDVSQYKFYQGFIQDKGTRNALTKLFDVLSGADKESLEFYEEWAIKNGQYGAATGFDEVEYKLDESRFRLVPQPILLTDNTTGKETDLIYRIPSYETYLKPEGYNHKPFPNHFVLLNTYTKNSGYVNPNDVEFILGTYDDLLKLDINTLQYNSYCWVGNIDKSWDVCRYTMHDLQIQELITLDGSSTAFRIGLNGIPTDIKVGDIVGLYDIQNTEYEPHEDSTIKADVKFSALSGFFKVTEKTLNQLQFEAPADVIADLMNNKITECTGILTIFRSVRVADTDALTALVEKGYDTGSKIWLDDKGNGHWNVLEKMNEVSDPKEIVNTGGDVNYGAFISVNDKNTVMVIGAPEDENGKAYVYQRSNQNMKWVLSEVLEPDMLLTDDTQRYGASVDISADGQHIIVGAPDASYVKSNSAGLFDEETLYYQGDIVEYQGNFWEALVDVRRSTEYVTFSSFYNVNQSLVDLDIDDDDDPNLNLLLTGNYPLQNLPANHFLVRLPLDTYKGVYEGVQIKLKWNTLTNANQTQVNLSPREPFDGEVPFLNSSFISDWHTIAYKVDVILNIQNLLATPSIGEQVSSETAVGRVAYVYNDAGNAIIYLNDVVGTFNDSGTLETLDSVLGDFVYVVPENYNNANIIANYGGYVAINLPSGTDYDIGSVTTDTGRGLLIVDMITDNSVPTRFYHNVLDYAPTTDYGDNTKHSMIHNFSRRGTRLINAGLYEDIETNLPYYGVRAPKVFTDTLTSGDTMSMYFNTLKKTVTVLKVRNTRFTFPPEIRVGEILTQENTGAYATVFSDNVTIAEETTDPSNPVYDIQVQLLSPGLDFNRIDELSGSISGDLFIRPVYEPVEDALVTIESIGINDNDFTIDDNSVNIWNLWDGFIDYNEDYYSYEGLPYVPVSKYVDSGLGDLIDTGKAPHIIRQTDTGATAEVQYVQRLGNTIVRVYVDNVVGDWTVGTKYGEEKELEMLANPGEVDAYGRANIYTIDRLVGTVIRTSLGYPSEGVGKMIVVRSSSLTDIVIDPVTDIQQDEMVGEEYWFYNNTTVSGVLEMSNEPSITSTVWRQIFNVEATGNGTPSSYIYEGLVYLYKRFGTNYVREKVLLSPQRDNSMYFGANVKVRKTSDTMYKGFVLAKAGDENFDSPGKIYFLNNGSDGDNLFYWDYAKYKQFRNVYSETATYLVNDVIYQDTRLLRARTNMLPGAFNPEYWEELSTLVDYVGYIPNDLSYTALVGDDASSRLDLQKLYDFGTEYEVSGDGEVLAAYIKYTDNPNVIAIYRNLGGQFVFSQNLVAPSTESGFGQSIAINNDGSLIAVGAPFDDAEDYDQGRVYLYKLENQQLTLQQTIVCPDDAALQMFGTQVSLDNDNLSISALNGDVKVPTTIDGGATMFDVGFTTLAYENKDTGTVYLYEKLDGVYVYGQKLYYENSHHNVYGFGKIMTTANNHIYVALPDLHTDANNVGVVVDYNKSNKFYKVIREPKATVKIDKIKQVLLYNTKTKQTVAYLDYVDPLQNKIPGLADENIRYKLYYDPASYNVSSDVSRVANTETPWGEKQVGQLWWDLTNAKYYYPYQDGVTFSTNYWSKTFDSNSIDIFEWVGSNLLPEEWDLFADTVAGNALGISGLSLYGNSSYVEKDIYDSVAQKFTKQYFYWVKNKRIKPNIEGRSLSSADVASLIQDPAGYGYRYVAFISEDSFAIYNSTDLLQDNDVAISIQYWTIDNQDINIHNEYQILSENLDISLPKRDIENKWIDSLVGYDIYGRTVPDPSISEKYRWGTLSEPRQGWFKNRIEAVKQWCEHINYVLQQHLIVDSKNLKQLYTADEYPSTVTAQYDLTVDTYNELSTYGTTKLQTATAVLDILDGEIRSIRITNPGRGYLVPPSYTINGKGEGAEISFTLNSVGSINSATVVAGGKNYGSSTTITIRDFAILVLADETVSNKWSMYSRDNTANSWNLIRVQGYNTALYWDFIDWYATGYNEYTSIKYVIDYTYQLDSLNDVVGDVVKINSVGDGTWLLLRKVNDIQGADYTVNYETIGRQNGTIKLKQTIYNLTEGLSNFDLVNFDTNFYDSLPSTEIRYIAQAIRDDIFVDDLLIEYNKLFFASIRYVLDEQPYVDWLFKTSFLRAKHNVGTLREDITFNNDNLPSYQEYINEVKAFKNKVREYISSYEALDNTQSRITDFDLAPQWNDEIGAIVPFAVKAYSNQLLGTTGLDVYPAKSWFDNSMYEVVDVKIIDPGSGYQSPPQITLEGGGGTGTVLKTQLGSGGKVRNIQILNSGSGYFSTPNAIINGSLEEGGTPLRVSVELGNGLARSFTTNVKFDRVSGKYDITNLAVSQTLTSAGSEFVLDLEWPMDLTVGRTIVTIDGVEALQSEFSYQNNLDMSKGYERKQGQISLTNAPAAGAQIQITYHIDPMLLTAADRINMFYDPAVGQFGKDLAQLMDGVDYGGVEVRSFDFGGSSGWDTTEWYTNNYDTYDMSYEDVVNIIPPHLVDYTALGYRVQLVWTNIAKAVNNIAKGDDAATPQNFKTLFSVSQSGTPVGPIDPLSILNVADDINGVTFKSAEKIQKYLLNELTEDDIIYIDNIETQLLPRFTQLTQAELESLIQEDILREIYFTSDTPFISGQTYNFYHNGVRLDDPDYGTPDQTNVNAVMQTITGDGIQQQILLRSIGITPNTDDVFALRKPDSDGSFLPSDIDFDTMLSGGNLSYGNAKGMLAEDIVVDGDNFVTPTTSKGPEEIVPGQVLDTLDLKVFDRPEPGVSTFTSRNFVTDGKTNAFPIGTQPLTGLSTFVKMDNVIKKLGKDYTIDAQNKTIVFAATPRAKRKLNIITLDYSGTDILDTGTIIADGTTTDFLVKAKHSSNLHAVVSVDAKFEHYVLLKADGLNLGKNTSRLTAIQFALPPAAGAVIRYAIFEGETKPYSEVTVDNFVADGSTKVYELTTAPLQQEPLAWHTLVIADGELLNPGYVETITITDVLEYQLKLYQVPLSSLTASQMRVFLNGNELKNPQHYQFTSLGPDDPAARPDQQLGSSITLNKGVAKPGDTMKVYVTGFEEDVESGGDYRYGYMSADNTFIYDPTKLYMAKELADGTEIQVYQFSNHDTQGIDWQSFDVEERTALAQGYIDSSIIFVVSDPVATITLNFELEYNQLYSVTLNDIQIDDINFGTGEPVTNPFARTRTIIGDGTNEINLASIGDFLVPNDFLKIEKVGAEVILDAGAEDWYEFRLLQNGIVPLNKPAKEEYYVWVAVNGKLLDPSVDYFLTNDKTHIRLDKPLMIGDNVQTIHFAAKPTVSQFGYRQFKDILNRTHYSVMDGSNDVTLKEDLHWYDKYIVVNNADKLPNPGYGAKQPGVIFLDKERIEYYEVQNDRIQHIRRGTLGTGVPEIHSAGLEAIDNSAIKMLPYKDETVTTEFIGDGTTTDFVLDFTPNSVNEFEVYVAGRRLRKNSIAVFDSSLAQDSPEGDVTLPAEFTINGSTLQLTNAPDKNHKVHAIRRLGRLWTTDGESLADSNSNIAKMIRSVQVDTP